MAVAALSAANDSLRTDAGLLFSPRAIAVACVLIAAALQGTEHDGARWAGEELGSPAEAAAALTACPVVLKEYREYAGREVRRVAGYERFCDCRHGAFEKAAWAGAGRGVNASGSGRSWSICSYALVVIRPQGELDEIVLEVLGIVLAANGEGGQSTGDRGGGAGQGTAATR